jgi:hypothetical protein
VPGAEAGVATFLVASIPANAPAVAGSINRDVCVEDVLDAAGRLELVAVALAAFIPADDLAGASAINRDVRAQA